MELDSVRHALKQASPCPLQQHWLLQAEPGFAPAVVRAGWHDQSLLVLAELADADIFTRATAQNQRLWELGDVLEIFLRPVGQPSYVEFQITPTNQWLQLIYPDARAVEGAQAISDMGPYLVWGKAFHSAVWLDRQRQRWFVFADIPASAVCRNPGSLANNQWLFSFSRYDYTRGEAAPVISSTSRHTKPDFHRQNEWGTMCFTVSPGRGSEQQPALLPSGS